MKKLAVGILLCLSFGVIAKEGGNGGFAYKKSIELLEEAQEQLINHLTHLKEGCVNQKLSEDGLAPLRLPRIIQIVKNLRMSFMKNKTETNPAGQVLPLMFSYGTDPVSGVEYIEALQPFFIANMSNNFSKGKINQSVKVNFRELITAEILEVQMLLLHEAVHFLGYSELDAEKLESVFPKIPFSIGFNAPNDCRNYN